MPAATPLTKPPRTLATAVWQVWATVVDVALRALPLLFLVVLALLSHWLIRHAPQADVEPSAKAASKLPDYVMHDFTTARYDRKGQLRARLLGQQLRHLPDQDVFEVDHPRHEQWDSSGRLTRSTARKGISNSDGSEIQLLTDVQVIRHRQAGLVDDKEPALRITGRFLHLKSASEQLSSHLPVVIEKDKNRFEANGMVYDNLSQQLVLQGAVKSRFVSPKPTRRP